MQDNVNSGHDFTEESKESNDLKALFSVLWSGKWIIIACVVVVGALGAYRAVNVEDTWTSKALITEPQSNDFALFQYKVNAYQPLFDVVTTKKGDIANKSLTLFVKPHNLFQYYINALNSTVYSKDFVNNDESYLEYRDNLVSLADIKDENDRNAYKRAIDNNWLEKTSVVKVDRAKNVFEIKYQSSSKENVSDVLSAYITFISFKANQDLLSDLSSVLDAKKSELIQKKKVVELEATEKLKYEVSRAEYALQIAVATGVEYPLPSLASDDLFPINLGSKGLNAKIKVLKSIRNLSIIDPRINQIDAKLSLFDSLQIDEEMDFEIFRYIKVAEAPVLKGKSDQILMVFIAAFIGLMMGLFFVMTQNLLSRNGFLK
ncbi:Wzz/FepE/Etk N-terminal domain-containing protein [Photobacterium sanguinicancri]|uniref:Wzz/FepE/Etk N-terminal domain-containing protein n=1 Tax=Photobacterium sanguinicancri TaxID=875932 RepID=UPI0024815D51|nr:Wzz/FepE/Etk N-terminal domain-containing protein [Photobacterium sanguinicancri]